jgi:hypothetical protein
MQTGRVCERLMEQPFKVHVHGIADFSRQIPDLLRANGWQVRNHDLRRGTALLEKTSDLAKCDLVFTYGGRVTIGKFLAAARLLGKDKLVMFWAGSDVLYARDHVAQGGTVSRWIAERIHWASSPWIAEEVRALGISCEYVPFNWAPAVPKPSPLPERFSVLTYLPDASRASLYGVHQILEVARALPRTSFVLVGLRQGRLAQVPPNVEVHGWAADLTPFYERAVALWRPVQHDGMSFMVLASLAHGRHVIYSYPFPGCVQATSAGAARLELERLREQHAAGQLKLNEPGRRIAEGEFHPKAIRAEVLRRWKAIIDEHPSEAGQQCGVREGSGSLSV